MFIGHFALGFAAKRWAPRVSLAVLFAAAQLADLLWPLFLAAGIEHVRIDPDGDPFAQLTFVSYPYSHSLLWLAIWGAAFALLYTRGRLRARAFPILLALVLSHWALDWLTHMRDLPIYPGGAKVGLGLWNSLPGTLALELAMFAVGVWIYAGATRARDRAGRWGFISLVLFLAAAYFASTFGPPPPSVPALYVTAILGSVVLLLWSAWADRHRAAV